MLFHRRRFADVKELLLEGEFDKAKGKLERTHSSGISMKSDLSKLIERITVFQSTLNATTEKIESAKQEKESKKRAEEIKTILNYLTKMEQLLKDIQRTAKVVAEKEDELKDSAL